MVDKFVGPKANGKSGEPVEPNDVLTVKDEQGRSLVCSIERSMEVDDHEYALLLPVDTPIEIFAWEEDEDGDDALVDLDDDELDVVFLTARAVLAEQEMTLNQTALTLTASGDLPEADDDDIVTLDLSEDAENLDAEDFQFLAGFFHEEQKYAIYTPLNPLLIFVRLQQDGQPVLLTSDEFDHIRPQLEDPFFEGL